MVEAARIARGKITDLATIDVEQFDALVIPGAIAKTWVAVVLGLVPLTYH